MLKPDYPIHTERLVLRPLDAATDVDAVHAYQSQDDVCRYIPYSPRTREQVAEMLADPDRYGSTIEDEGGKACMAVVVRDTGRLVGDVIVMWPANEHRTAEIGYVFDPAAAGNGYATEAAGALLVLAFEGLGAHRVIGRIDERNDASAGVLRRIGMRQEARLVENEWFKGEWTTELDFAILRTEWEASRT